MYEAVLCKVTATWFPRLWKYVQIYVSEIKKKAFHFFLLFTKKLICFCLFLYAAFNLSLILADTGIAFIFIFFDIM